MDVHFVLGGQRVTRDNWKQFGADVTPENLDLISEAVLDLSESMRCSEHVSEPSVSCEGATLHNLRFKVTACCPTFEKALSEELLKNIHPTRILRNETPGVVKVRSTRGRLRRMNKTFGPIIAGMFIDMVDTAMFGPLREIIGFPAGAVAGYWMGSIFELTWKQRCLCAVAAGIYCVIPGLRFVPLATLLGAYIRFRNLEDAAGNDD